MSSTTNILSAGIFLALLGALYYVVTYTELLSLKALRVEDVEKWAIEIDTEIVANLRKVNSIEFNVGVLQTEAYKSLIDTRVKLSEPSVSKQNPFFPNAVAPQTQVVDTVQAQ